MATETTPNLSLTIEENLTSTAKSNLRKIDELGSLYRTDQGGDANIQSANDIQLLPNYAPVGGSGSGGSILAGQPGQRLTDFTVYGPLSLDDTASDYKLSLLYTSSTASTNRTLTIDTNDASPTLSVEGNLTFSSNDLTIVQNNSKVITMPAEAIATLVGKATVDTFTNKTFDVDGAGNVLQNIRTAQIAADAAIEYSKLSLANSLLDSDVNAAAAIAGTKINPNFGSQNLQTTGDLVFGGGNSTTISAHPAPSVPVVFNLPPDNGENFFSLTTDGNGNLSWASAGTGSVTSVGLTMPSIFTVSNSPITTGGVIAVTADVQIANSVYAGPGSGSPAEPAFRQLVATDIPVIDHTKISDFDTGVFDILGAADTAEIDMAYDGAGTFQASLITTGVTGAAYGAADTVPTFTVDSKGRLTAAADATIAITASQVTDFTEAVQDVSGATFVDSTTIDFTYNDVANTVTAATIDTAIDHDVLTNFVADEHVAHSGVSITTASATSGLTGGGDITTTRNLSVDIAGTTLLATEPAATDLLLIWNGSALRSVSVSNLTKQAGNAADWAGTSDPADKTFTFNHQLSSLDVIVQVYDKTTNESIQVDTVTRDDADNITLTSSVVPGVTGWRVVVMRVN